MSNCYELQDEQLQDEQLLDEQLLDGHSCNCKNEQKMSNC